MQVTVLLITYVEVCMRGSKANFRCRLQFSCFLGQRLDEGGVKHISGAGNSSFAYLVRGWMRGSKANFRQVTVILLTLA